MAVAVGIIGAGTSATAFHAPFITEHPSFRLKKFLRTADKLVAGFEAVPVTDSIASFLPGIDLAVVTTPTHTHYELAKACLEAGKHVILEKPMAVSHSQCLQLCELAGRQQRLLAVYQNRRWDGDFQLVQQLLRCGALGRLVEYESHFDRFRNAVKPGWKESDLPGSGVLYDLGAHLLDQALTLFGHPSALTAHVLNQRQLPGSDSPDAFTITLHYKNVQGPPSSTTASSTATYPLTAILRASMLARRPGPRFLLHGSLGSFEKHGLDVQEGQLRGGLLPTDPGFGVEGPEGYGTLDSVALHMPPPAVAATRPRSAGSARPPSPAAAPAGAPGGGSSSSSSSAAAAVDLGWVQAGMLAHVAKSGGEAPGSSGAVVRVATPRGCWMGFYDEIASILLGDAAVAVAGPKASSSAQQKGAPADASATGADSDADAAAAAEAGGSGGINSRLSVRPEQAAAVVRLIEAAMQSSKEGRTIQL